MNQRILRTLAASQLQSVLEQAKTSPRKRANFNLHAPGDSLQRMVNAMLRGTYCQPHKHESPDKLEIFTVLQGCAAVARFNDAGEVVEAVKLDADGAVRQVEIPPRTWHTVMALSNEAILYEVIEGHYDPLTHKRFATFAPTEKSPESDAYLAALTQKVEALLAKG
jgi:cupin fold WbuC family metalloprotein